MLECCEGHVTDVFVRTNAEGCGAKDDLLELEEEEAMELLAVLEGGGCPVCEGMLPLKRPR